MMRSVCNVALFGALLPALICIHPAQAQEGGFAGLWIGDVAIHEVSRVGEASLEKTADVLHQRILLHVDASQKASLLHSAAVVWGKKGGPPGLYTDEGSLQSLLQGADGRDLTVKRLATASFDLPLESGPADPPLYASALTLTGQVGWGEKISTPEGGLVLDASHRSNPFRHAFHHEHSKGFNITREITLTIDRQSSPHARASGGPEDEAVSATYEETLGGLTREGGPIHLRGMVTLRRVSNTSRLNEMPAAKGGSR